MKRFILLSLILLNMFGRWAQKMDDDKTRNRQRRGNTAHTYRIRCGDRNRDACFFVSESLFFRRRMITFA